MVAMDKKKKRENIHVYTSMFMVRHFVIKYISAKARLLSTF